MAPKKITGYVKLQITGGKATPAPPVGPALGQAQVNIMEFCKQFNARTSTPEMTGMTIPVVITVYADRSFSFITKTPPAAVLLLKAAGIEKGSGTPNKEKKGKVTEKQILQIASQKMPDLNAITVEAAARSIRGTARSMGIEVVAQDFLPIADANSSGSVTGIEQWQGDFSGYGQELSGYAKRYGATYGDRLSSPLLGAALLPSLLHQDPRYFYRGHGHIIVRALYAVSAVAVCKGDNGHWQPNYSNVLVNLGAASISTLYYPSSDRHSVQVTVDNTLLGD